MPEEPNKLGRFWQELKRRRVVSVITVYAASAFVILELVSIITDPFNLPEWTLSLVIVLLCVGFIIAVILSWIYDISPDKGIVKTGPDHKTKEGTTIPSSRGWKIASYLSFAVILGLIILHILPRNRSDTEETLLQKSIAVLPFRNDSPNQENEYFINGVMESILDNLCKIEDLRVTARTSVEPYRNHPKKVTQIAEELNVSYILEGGGQRQENQIRLTVQLIDAVHDTHLWSRQYDREISDVFAIQSEIAQSIAEEIQAYVTPEVRTRMETEPTSNMEALDLYLQGRQHFTNGGRYHLDTSIMYYRQVLELDPDFALAWSALAASYSAYAYGSILPRREVMYPAREAALKALALDNTLGEAHAELAWTRIYEDFNWEEGEKGLQRALELNPNYSIAHRNYSWLLTFLGRHQESISEIERAIELDPHSLVYHRWLPRAYLYAGDYDRALEEHLKVLEKFSDSDYTMRWCALNYLLCGKTEEALELCAQLQSQDWITAYIYGEAGQTDKVKEILEDHLRRAETAFVKPTDFTVIYAALGDFPTALDYLEQAYEQREGWLVLLNEEPVYDNLRSDPRFQAVLEKMNFPDN